MYQPLILQHLHREEDIGVIVEDREDVPVQSLHLPLILQHEDREDVPVQSLHLPLILQHEDRERFIYSHDRFAYSAAGKYG
jgi:hypothetical protein